MASGRFQRPIALVRAMFYDVKFDHVTRGTMLLSHFSSIDLLILCTRNVNINFKMTIYQKHTFHECIARVKMSMFATYNQIYVG